jgi:hypothetical protein
MDAPEYLALHETVTSSRTPEAKWNLSDDEPLGVLDPWRRLSAERQDEQVFVQCAVVLDVPHHDWRHVPLGSRISGTYPPLNDLRPDFATCVLAKYALAHPLAFRPSLRWMIASTGGGGFQREAAHCSIIFCSAANPSVSAAGPGCKINDDLIS